MDLMSTAQLLGNLGEFFGAIAVLVTLAYLVVQTNVNSKMLRSGIYSAWVDSRARGLQMMADQPQLFSEIYTVPPRQFDSLSPVESAFFRAFFTHIMNYSEQTYLHSLDGAIDKDIFDTNHRQMVNLFRNPLHREAWNDAAHSLEVFDRRFVEYVDKQVLPDANLPSD